MYLWGENGAVGVGVKEWGDQGSRACLGELVDLGAEECLATAAIGPASKGEPDSAGICEG